MFAAPHGVVREPTCALRIRKRHSRARAAWIWGLAIFAGFQLASAVLVARWRQDLRDPEFGCKLALLRRRLTAEPRQPLVVALGSSRPEVGFRPGVLPAYRTAQGQTPIVFNFGIAGGGPFQELICLHRLLAEGIRPTWVLIEVFPMAFHRDGKNAEDLVPIDRLCGSDLELLPRYYARPADVYWQWWRAQVIPWYSHRFALMSRCAPAWLPYSCREDHFWRHLDRFGWIGTRDEPGEPAAWQQRVTNICRQCVNAFDHYRVSDVPDRAFRELLELCRKEGITATLVLMPETREVRGSYPAEVRSQMGAYLTTVCREYQVGLIDASDWVADKDFYDGHHLLIRGATAFTQRLGREVLQPFIEGPRFPGSRSAAIMAPCPPPTTNQGADHAELLDPAKILAGDRDRGGGRLLERPVPGR